MIGVKAYLAWEAQQRAVLYRREVAAMADSFVQLMPKPLTQRQIRSFVLSDVVNRMRGHERRRAETRPCAPLAHRGMRRGSACPRCGEEITF